MPGRNVVKQYAEESYYHVYSRGVAKQTIFNDEDDYLVFLSLFKRYLSKEPQKTNTRHTYPNYRDRVELLCYALMPNHIHLLIYQKDNHAIVDLLRSVMTSYSMYYNKKNKRVGPVFQSRYRASRIDTDSYLEHISRYIHLNPKDWEKSDKTSLKYYKGGQYADWVKPKKILDIFKDNDEYMEFLHDHEDHKQMLEEIKWELADQ